MCILIVPAAPVGLCPPLNVHQRRMVQMTSLLFWIGAEVRRASWQQDWTGVTGTRTVGSAKSTATPRMKNLKPNYPELKNFGNEDTLSTVKERQGVDTLDELLKKARRS